MERAWPYGTAANSELSVSPVISVPIVAMGLPGRWCRRGQNCGDRGLGLSFFLKIVNSGQVPPGAFSTSSAPQYSRPGL